MQTIKKFIQYYAPYKAVFFIDLLCAAFISLVDLAFPQILRTATNTLFTRDSSVILRALPLRSLHWGFWQCISSRAFANIT